MAQVIYEPRDTRFEEIFQPLAYGLGAVGKHLGETRRANDRAAALTELLSSPGQTEEETLTKILSSPEFANDPQAAIQMASSLYQARRADKASQQAKTLLNMVKQTNPGMFDGINPEDVDSLEGDQLSQFVNTMLDAQQHKDDQALTQRGQDIQKDLGLANIGVQREQIAASERQSQAQLAQSAAQQAEQKRQFDVSHDLDVAKAHADILQTNAATAATEAQTKLTELETSLKAAGSDDERAKVKADIEATKAQTDYARAQAEMARKQVEVLTATTPTDIKKAQAELDKLTADAELARAKVESLPAEKRKTEAEAALAESKVAAAPGEAAKTAAETKKAEAEAAKAAAEAGGATKGQKEFEAAAASTSERLGVSPQTAVRINQVESQVQNQITANYGGKYDPSTGGITFTEKATPAERAKASIGLIVASTNLAQTKGDPGKATARSVAAAEALYSDLTKAINDVGGLPSDDGAKLKIAASLYKSYGLKYGISDARDFGSIMDLMDQALSTEQ